MLWKSALTSRFLVSLERAEVVCGNPSVGDHFRQPVSGQGPGLVRGALSFPDQVLEIAAIVIGKLLGEQFDLRGGNESHSVSNLLDTGDLEALPGFDGLDVVRGLDQRLHSAGVKPGESSAEDFNPELLALEINPIDIGDLEFTTGRRTHCSGDIEDLIIIEVQPGYRVVRFRASRFFLDRKNAAFDIELDNAIALGILDRIGEDRCSAGLVARAFQHPLESLAVEDVVSQDQGDVVFTYELPANEKCLGQSTGTWLHGVPDGEADLSSIPQDPLKILDVVWRGYQENLANAGKHQRRKGIVNHRLVVDRQKLLADGSGNRIEPRSRTTGQNDAFAKHAWRFPRIFRSWSTTDRAPLHHASALYQLASDLRPFRCFG